MHEGAKRRILATLALTWVISLTLIFVASCFSPGEADRFLEANFGKLRSGMSRPEVEAIFGPAGDYATAPVEVISPPFLLECKLDWRTWESKTHDSIDPRTFYKQFRKQLFQLHWQDDRGSLCIWFYKDETVACARFDRVRAQEQELAENLIWRVKRLWRR